MTERAEAAWKIFNDRVSNASAQYKRPSPLSENANVLNFINGQKVEVCEDSSLQHQLEAALLQADYADLIFTNPKLPHIALKLFIDHKINREQISTLLEMEEAKKLGKIKIHAIFEADNKTYTQAARWYLLPMFQHRAPGFIALDKEQLEFFGELLLEVPLSERVFYTIPEPADKQNRFRNFLTEHGSMFLHESSPIRTLVLPSFSVKNARLIARCGIENTVGHVANLGKKIVSHIRIGEEHDIRYADIDFPQVLLNKTVHDYDIEEYEGLYNTNHDYHHALVGSITPRHYRHALLYMSDLMHAFCNRHGFKGYVGHWDLIDKELRYFLHAEAFDKNKMAHYDAAKFCDFLDYGGGGQILRQTSGHLLVPNKLTRAFHIHDYATDFGVLVMIDMQKHPQTWHDFGLDPRALTGDYKVMFDKVFELYPFMAEDEEHIQIFKFCHAAGLPTRELRLGMCLLIDSQKPSAKLHRNDEKSTLAFHADSGFLSMSQIINTVKNKFVPTLVDEEQKKALKLLHDMETLERNIINEKRQLATLKTFFWQTNNPLSDFNDPIKALKEKLAAVENHKLKAVLEVAFHLSELGTISFSESNESICNIM